MRFKSYTLSNGTKTINIYGVVHVADQKEYDRLNSALVADFLQHFVIHHEGVEMPEKYSVHLKTLYTNLAKITGKAVQGKPDVPFERHDVSYADMPFSSKFTIKVLLSFIRVVNWIFTLTDGELDEEFAEKLDLESKETPRKLPKFFRKTLLDERNKHAVFQALKEPKNVSMVWGKAHAEGMIELFEDAGYTLQKTSKLPK